MRPLSSARPTTLALATILVLPSVAGAADADRAGAERLTGVFEAYVGKPAEGTPKIVDVTPVGDHYDVSVDLDRLAAPLSGFGLAVTLGRPTVRLIEKPDGTWAWVADGLPPMTWTAPGRTGRLAFEGLRSEGIFDPVLGAATSQKLEATRMISEQSVPAKGDEPRVDLHRTDETLDFTARAVAAGAGAGVDVEFRQTLGALTQTLSITEGVAKGIPDAEVTIKVGAGRLDGSATGFRARELLDLWAHLVAHHGADDVTGARPAWKARVAALGPLVERLRETGRWENVEIETPVGFGSIRTLGVEADVAGATADGFGEMRIEVAGLELHSLFIPGWTARLIPTDFVLRGRAEGWNAAAALADALETVDFGAQPPMPPDAEQRLLSKLLPKGTVAIDLTGNQLRAGLWTLTLDGRLVAGKDGAEGRVTLRAAGLPDVAKALADPAVGGKADPILPQIEQAIAAAEHAPDGTLTWRFDFAGGKISLNGRPIAEEKAAAPAPVPPPQAAPPAGESQKTEKKPGGGKKPIEKKI